MSKTSKTRRLIPLSTVKSEPLQWLWTDRIPLKAITILDGDPGQGKSTLTEDWVARITRGDCMPDSEEPTSPAGVVLLQAEDNLGNRVMPNLIAAGADVDKVYVYEREQFQGEPFLLPGDLPLIEEAVDKVGAKLVVIDPVANFLEGNSNSERCVRAALNPLAALAERKSLAVVLVRHLAKHGARNAVYRGAGSIAIIGIARSALLVAQDPDSDDPNQHVLVQSKSNLSRATSLVYRTVKKENQIAVEWVGESKFAAQDLASFGRLDHSALQEAIEVLRTILVEDGGSRWSKEVFRIARDAGVATRTLQRAKRELRVKSVRAGGKCNPMWNWVLPEDKSQTESDQVQSPNGLPHIPVPGVDAIP